VVDADFTKRVKVTLSAAEMNGDNITVIFSDAAGAEWCDLIVNIQTSAEQIDTLDTNIDTLLTRLTALRAGYLDNLNIGENVAGTSEITALNDITVANILAGVVEGTVTIKHAIAAILAFSAGTTDGANTTSLVFKNQAASKDRITMTVNTNGERSAVTLDVTDL
jgi:hypothetical protein